jgi:GYF domain 2
MARERWFYAQGGQRRGPVAFSHLVESVLAQPDPRAVIVWRKGFGEWTRAQDVPEVERRLAPFLARKDAEEAARRGPVAVPVEIAPAPSAEAIRQQAAGNPVLVYGGIAAGVAVLALLGWLFWPRPQPAAPVPLGGTTTENAPAVVIRPGPTAAPVTVATPPPATQAPAPTPTPAIAAPGAVADRESDLPSSEVRKLKGVAAWSGEKLQLTVYNSTAWRVTELYVRVGRFNGDDLVEDPRPILMVPPGTEVAEGVADLLSRVAPERKKAGLNPLDTGIFEGKAGPRPESFRFDIESARGYAPRR